MVHRRTCPTLIAAQRGVFPMSRPLSARNMLNSTLNAVWELDHVRGPNLPMEIAAHQLTQLAAPSATGWRPSVCGPGIAGTRHVVSQKPAARLSSLSTGPSYKIPSNRLRGNAKISAEASCRNACHASYLYRLLSFARQAASNTAAMKYKSFMIFSQREW